MCLIRLNPIWKIQLSFMLICTNFWHLRRYFQKPKFRFKILSAHHVFHIPRLSVFKIFNDPWYYITRRVFWFLVRLCEIQKNKVFLLTDDLSEMNQIYSRNIFLCNWSMFRPCTKLYHKTTSMLFQWHDAKTHFLLYYHQLVAANASASMNMSQHQENWIQSTIELNLT